MTSRRTTWTGLVAMVLVTSSCAAGTAAGGASSSVVVVAPSSESIQPVDGADVSMPVAPVVRVDEALPPAAPSTSTATSTTSVTITPTSATMTVTARTAMPKHCGLGGLGYDRVIVFGNSTDYSFEPGHPIDLVAWPDRLVGVDAGRGGLLFDGVVVQNEAQRGQTMGDWDDWGWERTLNLSTHLEDVLAELPAAERVRSLALIAPSFIDLQSNGYDPARAIDDMFVRIATLAEVGIDVVVLPMNPVSEALDGVLPRLNPAIAEFNRLLSTNTLVTVPLAVSPLVGPDGVSGDDALYDDFPGYTDTGEYRGADGFHPDDDGHRLKADVVVGLLTDLVAERLDTDC